MTDAELGLELYVVVGNALNLLLRGMPAEARTTIGVDVQRVERLDDVLSPAAPTAMLEAVRTLSAADRAALAEALLFCTAYAGDGTETVLGAPERVVRELAARVVTMSGD